MRVGQLQDHSAWLRPACFSFRQIWAKAVDFRASSSILTRGIPTMDSDPVAEGKKFHEAYQCNAYEALEARQDMSEGELKRQWKKIMFSARGWHRFFMVTASAAREQKRVRKVCSMLISLTNIMLPEL